jgi:apoptosis-inducing factor 2
LAAVFAELRLTTLQIASGPTVLEGSPANVSKIAMKELQNLKVQVKLQTRVIGSAELPNSQQEITLSDGDPITADMYIPMFGLKPNSSYLPPHLLNADGLVIVDEHLRVKGTDDVWAIGDISDIERAQYKAAVTQSAHLAKSITSILANKASLPYKVPTRMIAFIILNDLGHWLILFAALIGLSIGRKAGTGHYGTMRIPSFVIVMARKNLFIDNMGPTVDGSLF